MEKYKKKRWKSFEVTKVKLNPEQAVLSCCLTPGRGAIGLNPELQCVLECGNDINSSSS